MFFVRGFNYTVRSLYMFNLQIMPSLVYFFLLIVASLSIGNPTTHSRLATICVLISLELQRLINYLITCHDRLFNDSKLNLKAESLRPIQDI